MKKLLFFVAIVSLITPIAQAENSSSEALKLHNEYRAEVFDTTKSPLVWDEALADDATLWAEFLAENFKYADRGQNPHAAYFKKGYHALWKGGQGENIAWGKPSMNFTKGIGLWGAEQNSYNHETFTCEPGKVCGHYTQIIWEDTTKVGCGFAKSTTDYGGEWVVCRYEAPGNYIGQKPYVKDPNYIPEDTTDPNDPDLLPEGEQKLEQETQESGDKEITPSSGTSRGSVSNKDYQIYKKVNLGQDAVENKIKNGKKIIAQIKEIFRKLRKNRDIKTINAIKTKTGDLLTKLREKETLSAKEQKIFILVEYLFYRSHVEAEELK